MPNPWVIVGVLIALAAFGYGGERIGEHLNDRAWQAREAKLNADTAKHIADADKKVLDSEHAKAAEIDDLAGDYEAKLQEKNHALTTALATVKSGGLFVRAACPSSTGNGMPNATAGAGLGDGQTVARLSDADSGFLLTEASRADGIVAQLTACQSVIRADRGQK